MECNRIANSTKNLNSIPLKSSNNRKLSGCERYETDWIKQTCLSLILMAADRHNGEAWTRDRDRRGESQTGQKGHLLLARDHGRHRLLLHLLFITSKSTPFGALSLGDNMGGATIGSATAASSFRPISSDRLLSSGSLAWWTRWPSVAIQSFLAALTSLYVVACHSFTAVGARPIFWGPCDKCSVSEMRFIGQIIGACY